MELAARTAALRGENVAGPDDDIARLKRYGFRKAVLSVLGPAFWGAMALWAIKAIPDHVPGSERRFYYLAILAVAFVCGRFVKWVVKAVFHEDISK